MPLMDDDYSEHEAFASGFRDSRSGWPSREDDYGPAGPAYRDGYLAHERASDEADEAMDGAR
jgi:hypothetical protein